VKRILGRLPEAEASARKAVELDPGEFAGQETLGFVLLKRKDLDGALEHYGAALRIDPTRIEPYVGLGYAQALRKEFKFAEDMLEKALKIDKDDVDANLKMGIVAYQKKDYRRAARHIQVVLRQDPQNLIAQRYMGYVLLNEGKAKEALDVLKKASIAAETEDAMTIRMMGRALFELGNKEEALTAFQRAVAVDEKDPWAHFDLGKAQEDGEEYPLAQASYEKAIELDATFSWPHLYLAELLDEVLDQKPEALAHYQRFLELSGPDPESDVKRRIDQLQKDVK
jgi:tetratricopeptide (TPR) repeat protein